MWNCVIMTSNFMFSAHLDQLSEYLSLSLSICPFLYLSISFSPCICACEMGWSGMHYSSVCPFCHCRAGLWAEGCKAELQSINQGLTLTTMGYGDWMSQDIHANRKVLWAILYTLRLSEPFLHQQQLKFIGSPEKTWLLSPVMTWIWS